jgi:hypothetical protein
LRNRKPSAFGSEVRKIAVTIKALTIIAGKNSLVLPDFIEIWGLSGKKSGGVPENISRKDTDKDTYLM